MGQFALLPAELQIKIFGCLGSVDIKAARLVSRDFRDNAAPALFRSIILCPRFRIIRTIQDISMHPAYSNYVKELVFDGTLYSTTVAADIHFYKAMEKASGREFSESEWTPEIRFQIYKRLLREQENTISTGLFKLSLVRCLEKMPNISSIVYSPHQRTIPVETRNQNGPVPTGHPPSWINSTELTGPKHHFCQLIAAIFESGYTGIRELIIETPDTDGWMTQFAIPIFTFPDSDILRAGQHLFRNLVRLELSLSLSNVTHKKNRPRYVNLPGQSPVEQFHNLATLLESAQKLKHLSLILFYWGHSPQSMYGSMFPDGEPIFRRLGLGATWPKLRSLRLHGIYAWKQDMVDFIDRHRDMLEDLRITTCSLCGGAWADVVDHVISKAPSISMFALFSVNEFNAAYEAYTAEQREEWRYQGYLIDGPDGKLEFINTDPKRKSVYDAPRS